MMKYFYSAKSINLSIIIFSIIISCTGDTIVNSTQIITVKEFPNEIGDRWRYFYYDSLSSSSDTVLVHIVGDTVFNESRTAKKWKYIYKNKNEYRYVEVLNDTVRIFTNLGYLWQSTKFILPLRVDNGWRGDFVSDTSFVVRKEPISVLAGHFSDSYLIKETWGAVNDYGKVLTWIVPGVGIVKRHHQGWSFGMANNYWELLDYKIKP